MISTQSSVVMAYQYRICDGVNRQSTDYSQNVNLVQQQTDERH